SVAIGTLVPLVRLHPAALAGARGVGMLAAVALVLAGVVACALAAGTRGPPRGAAAGTSPRSWRGLTLALGSGVGAAMVNLGLSFGGALVEGARRQGAAVAWAPNAIWVPVLLSGALPNALYCLVLLRRNRTTANFGRAGTRRYWLYALAMATL